ncbi:MAG TPA: CotY/CotZ family spore coat protein [Solibacillus sp.]
MNNENHKQPVLYGALNDLKQMQDLLANSWSKYYGHFFEKLVGSDTIPFCFTTKECRLYTTINPKKHTATSFFRLEAIEASRVKLTLLHAVDIEEQHTNVIKDVVRLEKTDTQITLDFSSMLAIQLLEPALLSKKNYIESKW